MVNDCCMWPSTCMFELHFITVVFLFGKRCVWILKNHENESESPCLNLLPLVDVFWDNDDISVTGPPEVTKSLEWSALFRVQSHTEKAVFSFFSSSRLNQWVLLVCSLGAKELQNDGISQKLTLVGGERDSLAPSIPSISCTSSPSHIKSTKKSIHYSNLIQLDAIWESITESTTIPNYFYYTKWPDTTHTFHLLTTSVTSFIFDALDYTWFKKAIWFLYWWKGCTIKFTP